MFSNIKEMYLANKKKGYISIPKNDFFQIYDDLTINYAQQLVSMYFLSLSKEDYGKVVNIINDINSDIIKIELEMKDYIASETI